MKFEKDHLCLSCEQWKIHRQHHKSKTVFAVNKPLYLLHMDLCGPMHVESYYGKRYVLVVVDDYSRYTWVFFIHPKDEASENKTLAKFFDEVSITQQFSATRTPQQNGVVERRNITLVEAARTMLTFANLPLFLWAAAIATACFIQNRSIIYKRFDKTPYELINKRKPNIKFFRVFGCRCYLLNDYEDVGKLKPKRDIEVFVRYSKESSASRIYHKRTRKMHESVNVNFYEISKMASKQFSLEPGLSNLKEREKSLNPSVLKVSEASKKELEDLFQGFYDEYFYSSKIMKSSTTNVETSINEEVFHEVSESFQGESSSSSLNDDVQQSPEEVILPQTNTQLISNNMVPNGDEASTSHNVFNERLENAYFDANIFTDLSIEAIRLLLAYAAHKNFTVFKMDVKTAFLNGIIKEELNVGQPSSFVSMQYPDHVYALDKALYGLKKAPRAWYDVLSQFLIESGFQKVPTLMVEQAKLKLDLVGKPIDHTNYRSMIGSLMYVSSSRPDIMFATCLWYSKDSGFDLTAYSDADHAGCHIDQKTESEYVAVSSCCAQVL
nr:retrovirus-related Pol polyprotein from transposon TNT 1-94 [Tanacetum cinerariifolium]